MLGIEMRGVLVDRFHYYHTYKPPGLAIDTLTYATMDELSFQLMEVM